MSATMDPPNEEDLSQRSFPRDLAHPDVKCSQGKRKSDELVKIKILLGIFFLISLVLFVVGIVLMNKGDVTQINDRIIKVTAAETYSEEKEEEEEEVELYSTEAQRSGFKAFLDKMGSKMSLKVFDTDQSETYDEKPERLKEETDESWGLLQEIDSKDIDVDKLYLREQKTLAQLKHYLKHVFGKPLNNYYSGYWMLGPSTYCWQSICKSPLLVTSASLNEFHNLDTNGSLQTLNESLQRVGRAVDQYVENMKLGVRAGMIRSVEECEVGVDTIQRKYQMISANNGTGILDWYNKTRNHAWLNWNKVLTTSELEVISGLLVQYVGTPINNMLRYMEHEHMRHCSPSSVSSGLGSLPLDYVYVDGKLDLSQPTTKRLPSGEKLSGKEAYKMILHFFITNDMTPEQVHQLGLQMVKTTYSQIIAYAKTFTGITNTSQAVEQLKNIVNSSDMFYADSFPEEESGKTAHDKCVSEKTARKHCPRRWEAVSKWIQSAREVTAFLESKLTNIFYFTSEYKSTPSCPVQLEVNFDPSTAVQSYRSSGPRCHYPGTYYLPFWLDRPGPIYKAWSVGAHEGNPGHHLQLQGHYENFIGSERGIISLFYLLKSTSQTAFTEGWALYAESPILEKDLNIFNNPEAQLFKYGVYSGQMWRALRLVIDTGLHYHGYTREWALSLFEQYAWTMGDVPAKEVNRYQSHPGQATTYMIGQQHIYKLRNYTQEHLGKTFNIKEFHFQILSQGNTPLTFLQKHIEKYVKCKIDSELDGCKIILSPRKKEKTARIAYTSSMNMLDLDKTLSHWEFYY